MSFFNFFKRKKQIENGEEELSFSDLDLFIKNKDLDYEKRANQIKKEIQEKIDKLVLELILKKKDLKGINLENRKEEEKLKKIVLENISIYINNLDRLILSLKNLKDFLTIEEYIQKMRFVFNNFRKNSEKSIEKATILIGEEFEGIENILRNFAKQFNEIIIDSEKKFKKKNYLKKIKKIKEEYDYYEKSEEEITERLIKIKKEKENLKKGIIFSKKEKENFEGSREYKKYQEELENNQNKKENLDRKILNLKEKINIKLLLKIFHNNEKKYLFLKNYQENFIKTFEKDKDLEIIKLIKEGLNQNLEKEIEEVKEDLKKIKQEINYTTKNKIEGIQEEISKKNHKLMEISKEIENEEKKIFKFKENKKEKLKEIEENFKYLNVILIQ